LLEKYGKLLVGFRSGNFEVKRSRTQERLSKASVQPKVIYCNFGYPLSSYRILTSGGVNMDTKCQCEICGKTKMVVFAHCLLNGWPQCCNQRMKVKETSVDVEAVISQTLASIEGATEVVIHRS
jgi:hypothetical protein